MAEELEAVLRLVAEGRLTPEEAAPIIEALTARPPVADQVQRGLRDAGQAMRNARSEAMRAARIARDEAREVASAARSEARAMRDAIRGRHLRIRVTERGRQVVNLRIPLAFADSALRVVPGLGEDQAARIRQAIDAHVTGPIVDVEDEAGSGVLISVE